MRLVVLSLTSLYLLRLILSFSHLFSIFFQSKVFYSCRVSPSSHEAQQHMSPHHLLLRRPTCRAHNTCFSFTSLLHLSVSPPLPAAVTCFILRNFLYQLFSLLPLSSSLTSLYPHRVFLSFYSFVYFYFPTFHSCLICTFFSDPIFPSLPYFLAALLLYITPFPFLHSNLRSLFPFRLSFSTPLFHPHPYPLLFHPSLLPSLSLSFLLSSSPSFLPSFYSFALTILASPFTPISSIITSPSSTIAADLPFSLPASSYTPPLPVSPCPFHSLASALIGCNWVSTAGMPLYLFQQCSFVSWGLVGRRMGTCWGGRGVARQTMDGV